MDNNADADYYDNDDSTDEGDERDMYNNDAFRNNSEDMRDSKRTKKTICEGRVKCTQENIKHPLQNKGTPPKKRKKKKKSKSNHKFVVFQK